MKISLQTRAAILLLSPPPTKLTVSVFTIEKHSI